MGIRIEKATATRLPRRSLDRLRGGEGKKKGSGKEDNAMQHSEGATGTAVHTIDAAKGDKACSFGDGRGCRQVCGKLVEGSALSSAAVVCLANHYQPQCQASPFGAQRTV